MKIYRTPSLLRRVFPEALWKMETSQKNIFLTFDDGPHPGVTEWVLDILDQYDAKSTFFCLGRQVESNPSLYGQIIQAGHLIGNHSQNHLNGWKSNVEDYVADVKEATRNIDSSYFRPPYGKLKFSQYEALKEDFQIVMWDIVSYDWVEDLDQKKCLKNISKNSEAGTIIVFHDSPKAFKNLKFLLPRYLKMMKDSGFTFKSLDRLPERVKAAAS